LASTAVDGLSARYGPNYRWFVIFTAMIGNIALIFSSTIINVAIPEIMGAFGVGQDQAQWLSAGFLVTMTVSMLLNSWTSATIGRRNTYLVAMAVFVAGSVLGATSPTFDLLVFARLLQGAGAGLIQPLALQVIYEIFPPEQRGRAMGIFGLGIVMAPAFGPTLGGFLVDSFDWRAVFYMVLPFCAVATVMAFFFMPSRETDKKAVAFDWTGLVLMTIFLACLMSGMADGSREGWGSDIILTYFGVALIAIVAFVWCEWRSTHAMLNLRLFAYGRFVSSCIVSFVWGAGNWGVWYLVPLFVQIVQGYTPTRAGLLLMPASLLLAAIFPLSGRLSDWVAPRVPIVGGMFVTGVSCYLMASADLNTPFWLFVWWLIIGRVALGFVFPALTAGGLRALPADLVGQGAGLMSYFRQLGAAFGVTLLATTVESRTVMYAESFVATQTSGNAATADFLREMQAALSRAGAQEALLGPGALHQLGQTLYEQATMIAYRDGFLLVAVFFFCAMIPAWFLNKTREG
jgi:DHA2 family multidrug resistance protein